MQVINVSQKEYEEFMLDKSIFSQYQHGSYADIELDYNNHYLIKKNNKTIGAFRGNKRLIKQLNRLPFMSGNEFIVRRSIYLEEKYYQEFSLIIKDFIKENDIILFSLSPSELINDYNLDLPTLNIKDIFTKNEWTYKKIEEYKISRIAHFEQVTPLSYNTFEEVEKTFKKDTMRKVRKALKVGVSVTKIDNKDIQDYYYLFEETGSRDGFSIRDKEFYQRLVDTFKSKANIYISTLDLKAYKEHVKVNQSDREDILENIDNIKEDKIVLGLAICIDTDVQRYYHSGATSNLFRETMHNYLLHYEAIKEAFDNNLVLYNFGVINGGDLKIKDSLYQFKTRFAPLTIENQGEFIVYNSKLEEIVFKILNRFKRG
ncbi:MAG: lipid II:glycine glycyltransferase FemX [Mycoplasmatales bacterium]